MELINALLVPQSPHFLSGSLHRHFALVTIKSIFFSTLVLESLLQNSSSLFLELGHLASPQLLLVLVDLLLYGFVGIVKFLHLEHLVHSFDGLICLPVQVADLASQLLVRFEYLRETSVLTGLFLGVLGVREGPFRLGNLLPPIVI